MEIKVKLLQPFSAIAGTNELIIETDGRTVKSVLVALAKKYPRLKSEFFDKNDKNGMIKDHLNIMINERLVFSSMQNVKLKDNDELVIFMAVSGG